jgi:hypothetical protein
MGGQETQPAGNKPEDFARAAEQPRIGLVREFLQFLACNKKWWMIPLLLVIALLAGLILCGSNPAIAPFIYSIF